jgi:hydroxymethylglutaryl-CoA lyase
MEQIKLTECPRDAMQGIHDFIPSALKAEYINSILKVGFDVVDFGSFVSPKAIPQLKDTKEVLGMLDLNSNSKLLSIVANARGARDASQFKEISIVGFPFSISETFQLRNTNSTRLQAIENVKDIKDITGKVDQKLKIYLSMGFGNPYGDEFTPEIVLEWASKLNEIGIEELALSDTIGVSNQLNISVIYGLLKKELPEMELSVHLHSAPHNWKEKIVSAYDAGCRSFDSAIKGYGGCPMAEDDLVGNIATENLIGHFSDKLQDKFDLDLFNQAMQLSQKVFMD